MWAYGLRCFNNLNNSLPSFEWTNHQAKTCLLRDQCHIHKWAWNPLSNKGGGEEQSLGMSQIGPGPVLGASHMLSHWNRRALSSLRENDKGTGKATDWLFCIKTLPFRKKIAEKSTVNVFFTHSQVTSIRYSFKIEKGGLKTKFLKAYLSQIQASQKPSAHILR